VTSLIAEKQTYLL